MRPKRGRSPCCAALRRWACRALSRRPQEALALADAAAMDAREKEQASVLLYQRCAVLFCGLLWG